MTHKEKISAYISLGGNMGGEAERFDHALARIDAWPGIRVAARSSLYRTEPQGDADQSWFTNQVAMLECVPAVLPETLLRELLRLEADFGRVRDGVRRFGPRPLDLDILLFGDHVFRTETLKVPHPRMLRRAFVLVPLLEIAPDLRLPDGTAAADGLARLRYIVDGKDIYQKD